MTVIFLQIKYGSSTVLNLCMLRTRYLVWNNWPVCFGFIWCFRQVKDTHPAVCQQLQNSVRDFLSTTNYTLLWACVIT